MQMGRLFEIVYLLLEQKQMTAAELAERFEVSVRTIYRDMDQLSLAGIPVYANKGRGGGIGILDEFVLNKSVLTEQERSEILWALQGVSAVKGVDGKEAISKLSSFFGTGNLNWIEVDFSSWGYEEQQVFDIIKTAVMEKKMIEMDYYNSAGERGHRCVEPLQLCFKGKSWYVKAYCNRSQGYRLFKITRMRQVRLVHEQASHVLQGDAWNQGAEAGSRLMHMVSVKLWIDQSQSYRVYDDFSDGYVCKQKDGSFHATLTCPENEWLYGYILSYGSDAKVLSPDHVKEKIRQRIRKMSEIY